MLAARATWRAPPAGPRTGPGPWLTSSPMHPAPTPIATRQPTASLAPSGPPAKRARPGARGAGEPGSSTGATGAASGQLGGGRTQAPGGTRQPREGQPRPGQEDRRQRTRQTPQRDHVGAAGRTAAMVIERQAVALALAVEDPVRERPHQRALAFAPSPRIDRAREGSDLAGDPGIPGAAALHQLAHPPLADPHLGGRLGAGEPLQVTECGRLGARAAQLRARPRAAARGGPSRRAHPRAHRPRCPGPCPLPRAGRVAETRAVLIDGPPNVATISQDAGLSICRPSSTAA